MFQNKRATFLGVKIKATFLRCSVMADLPKDKDSVCNKLDEVLIQIYAMQNEFKEGEMKDWRELSLILLIIIS